MPKWLLSKRFCYGLLALIFIFILASFAYLASTGNVFASTFIPEIMGWLVTLLIFTIFFDLREELEWKKVEGRVKKRMGSQIHALFANLSIFCQVERVIVDPLSEKRQAELVERQLNSLASAEIKFTVEAKKDLLDEELRRSYEMLLDSKLNSLSRIEGNYSKFLGSEVRASLMDIQDYLDELSLEFRIRHIRNEDYFKVLSDLIGKTMKEIQRLKRFGFWVNW